MKRECSLSKFTLRCAWISLLHLLVIGTAFAQAPFADEPPAKTDLREAIFRYMFEHYNNYRSTVRVFCIQPETPQPEKFLRRFAENKTRVVWASDCEMSGPMYQVKETRTGQRGLRMTISTIRWLNGSEVEASVEAFSDGIAANWNTLQLTVEGGHWIVKHDKLTGVS